MTDSERWKQEIEGLKFGKNRLIRTKEQVDSMLTEIEFEIRVREFFIYPDNKEAYDFLATCAYRPPIDPKYDTPEFKALFEQIERGNCNGKSRNI